MPKKTKIFVAILIVIIFILIIINLFLEKSIPTTAPLSPTPTLHPQGDANVLEQQKEIGESDYPLLGKTPYTTTSFEITYSGPRKLKVIMFINDQEKIKQAVSQWLISNGVKPETHQIVFINPQ